MKKRLITIIGLVIVLAVSLGLFTACNNYSWGPISGGNSSAVVESNGKNVVKQGDYIYFINGMYSDTTSNTWGGVVNGAIVRATLNSDGSIASGSYKVIVPKNVYVASATGNGGIYIYGSYIYYATANNEQDQNGTPSTTNLDFMRTKIDGTDTKVIKTISTRTVEYRYTSTRLVYVLSNTIYSVDFSGNTKTIKESTTSHYLNDNAGALSDYIFYTIASSDSNASYNELHAVKADGSGDVTLVNGYTYLADGATEETLHDPAVAQQLFKLKIIAGFMEADGAVTLYYTKSVTINSTETLDGLYMATVTAENIANSSFNVNTQGANNEKHIALLSYTSLFPLGYEYGALAIETSYAYLIDGRLNAQEELDENVFKSENAILDSSVKIQFINEEAVSGGTAMFVYYTHTSSATSLYRININATSSAAALIVMKTGAKEETAMTIDTSWFSGEFIDGYYYFINTNQSNYLCRANVNDFDEYTINDEDGDILTIAFELVTDKEIKGNPVKELTPSQIAGIVLGVVFGAAIIVTIVILAYMYKSGKLLIGKNRKSENKYKRK